MARILLISKQTGEVKAGYYGVCWLYIVLGPFVPLVREGPGVALKHFMYTICTLSIYYIIQIFKYNKDYTTRRLREGWNFAGSDAENRLAATALGVAYERVTEAQVGKEFG